MGIINDFQGGYRDGKAGKYTAITIILLIAVALYFSKNELVYQCLIGL